ncbi:hypothetical protein F5X98DRAFT_370475 [Xylaria grammica]|nr:hypothetical protein F5X98DRAFT_370475 [Xylaria grammica]
MNNCFSDSLIEPVQSITIRQDHGQNEKKLFFESCTDLGTLECALRSSSRLHPDIHFISVCQRNSWRPLQITQPMFKLIVDHYGLNESAYELSSCFYTRNLDLEYAYCAPLSIVRSEDLIDTSYTLRYPEFNKEENRWALRQSGIYHRFNQKTTQQFFLLLSPLPNSAAHRNIENQLLNRMQSASDDPFWIHGLMFSTYIPTWRQYMAWLEARLIPITNLTMIAEIDQEMRVGYEKLNALYILINQLFQIPTLTSHSLDVLDSLLSHSLVDQRSNPPTTHQLDNCRRQTAAYSRTAACLHQRAQTTAQLLSDTLSLREQIIAKNQAENMASLSKSTYWITIMGLLYLPITLVATIFGTNFFNFDVQRNTVVASTDIWYFFVASGILTLVTLLACYWFREYGTVIPRQAFQAFTWREIRRLLRDIRQRDKKIPPVSSV